MSCLTGELMDLDLSTREMEVLPGIIIDRDVNGAINIARKNLGYWSPQVEWVKSLTTSKRYVVV